MSGHSDGMMSEVPTADLITILTAAEVRLSELALDAAKTIDRRRIMEEYDAVMEATTRLRGYIRKGL